MSRRLLTNRKTYRTAATGPSHGMSLKLNAVDAAFIARMSGKCTESMASILHTNWVAHLIPLGKSGRSDRSINLAVTISFSGEPYSKQGSFWSVERYQFCAMPIYPILVERNWSAFVQQWLVYVWKLNFAKFSNSQSPCIRRHSLRIHTWNQRPTMKNLTFV